jgi:hypothetical protein
MDAQPGAIGALDPAAVMIPVIAAAAPIAFRGNGGTRACAENGADGRTAAAPECAAHDGPGSSAEEGAPQGVLGRRLMRRHRQGKSEQGRNPNLPNHSQILL